MSKDYVRSLEDRIAVLENVLRQRGQSMVDHQADAFDVEVDVFEALEASPRAAPSAGREDATVDAITDNLDRLRVSQLVCSRV